MFASLLEQTAFQDVKMRLIAERLLPPGYDGQTYMQGEVVNATVVVPPPRGGCKYHLFCTGQVPGIAHLITELTEAMGVRIEMTGRQAEMSQCECCLVYLNGLTWTSGERSEAFAAQVEMAMELGVRLLLVHEMVSSTPLAKGPPDALYGDAI